jgi:hypothetical protein
MELAGVIAAAASVDSALNSGVIAAAASVEASALKAVVVSAADKDTAEDFGTAAVAVEEQPVACLAFVSEN